MKQKTVEDSKIKEYTDKNNIEITTKINLLVDILFFILTFLFMWFSNDISQIVSVLIVGLLYLVLSFLILLKTGVTIILNIVAIVIKLKERNFKVIINIIAMLISVLIMNILYTFNFQIEKVKFEHFLYQSEREQSINSMTEEEIKETDNSILYKTYDDGEILVGYWVHQGMLSSYSLLYYTSVDDPEIIRQHGGGATKTVLHIEKIDENWYYAEFE